jgi:hypothetical protein
MGNFIYVAGGMTSDNFTNSVERYDINADCWEYLTPLPFACFSMTLVAIQNRYIICIGCRFDSVGASEKVMCFDTWNLAKGW